VLNALDGFNLQPQLPIPFTGPIDAASVSNDTATAPLAENMPLLLV
jgi:hypothetical protein